MGSPEIGLTLASTNPRVDVFVRLCEVDERGRSRTVTDGYLRLPRPQRQASRARSVSCSRRSPIASPQAAASACRCQGRAPLHLRNPGTSDPVRDHSRLVASTQTLFLGGATPAVLALPLPTTRHPPFTRACHDDGCPSPDA
jgi:hypothetical protein